MVGESKACDERRRILIVGASGVIGRACFEHFSSSPDWAAYGLSRRSPGVAGGVHLSIDLLDRERCAEAIASLPEPTHVVYCALREDPGLIPGWFDSELMQTNRRMLENLLDAIGPSGCLEHVSLLQGTKAYGAHRHAMRIPGRESAPRDPHENFYWLQEDLLRELAAARDFGFTIWRPPVMFGHAIGAPMNPLAAIGSFAALRKAEGKPLVWPGGKTAASDGLDARLLAKAIEWATAAEAARDQVFNITNGDVFVWENVWRSVAEAMDMELGPPEPQRLQETMPQRAELWDQLVSTHGLRAPGLMDFVGDSYFYVDMLFGMGRDEAPPPTLLSTIKLRQAGFSECIDSEIMLVEWLRWHREAGYLPRD